MFPLDLKQLTPEQRAMVDLWEEHLKAEFQDKDASASCDTVVARPYVNHVPVLTGGVGRRQLEHFYGRYFIPSMPPDVELVPISRTVGQNRIVDEFVFRCTHTVQMDWLLPGVPPTGPRLELVKVVVVYFENGKIHHEHIHWDQASALVQLGLLDPAKFPGGRGRGYPQDSRPRCRAVEPLDEADDYGRAAVTRTADGLGCTPPNKMR